MSSPLVPDVNRLLQFEEIDAKEVKEYIGEGRNHLVFKYKSNWVIKIPKVTGTFMYSDSESLQTDLELIKKYFPELMVTTKLISNSDHTDYVMLQRLCQDGIEIIGEMDLNVRAQLKNIIQQNKKLYSHSGRSLDLFGSSGFITSLCAMIIPSIKPKLSNILVRKKGGRKTLFLIDTELLRLSKVSKKWVSLHFQIRSWVSYQLTSFLLRTAFKFSYA